MERSNRKAAPRQWRDENTGREVRMLTDPDDPDRPSLPYFMTWKHLADGRLAIGYPRQNCTMDPRDGAIEPLPDVGRAFQVAADGSRIYCWDEAARHVVALSVPGLEAEVIAEVADLQFRTSGPLRISCDERYLIAEVITERERSDTNPYSDDASVYWHHMNRPRGGELWTFDLDAGAATCLVRLDDCGIIYTDPSPTDPSIIKFCYDLFEGYCQRIWTVRIDGGEPCAVRPQQRGEIVAHDIWWPDGQYVVYTYQDRRDDPTIPQIPYAEYAAAATRVGLSRPDGPEVYLSDPLGHWHSHVNVSRDGHRICGEGTHDYPFLCAADFSMESTAIDLVPQATIHTPYAAAAGHGLQADFTHDGEWLLYHDTIDGSHHICAVRVEL